MTESKSLRRTALWERHKGAGGKLVPFAGWEMPVRYSSIVNEHRAVRESAGLIDVSHMGEIEITGPDRFAEVDRLTTAKVTGKEPGFVQYALLLNDAAGIIDDILVYVLPETILLVVNAANRHKDFAWVCERLAGEAVATDASDRTSQIAVQGPRSREVMQRLSGGAVAALPYYRSVRAPVAGVDSLVSRTGYTGEVGYEIYCPWDDGPALWDAVVEAGRDLGLMPVGLGARDSLRMEMAYCLYGNEIDEKTNPVEAGLRWAVRLKKEDWIGGEAYRGAKEAGVRRRLTGFRLGPRDIPRPGYEVLHGGTPVGAITSGGFSPSCGVGIGLGYVESEAASEVDGFTIRIRAREARATPVRGPFVASSAKGEEEERV